MVSDLYLGEAVIRMTLEQSLTSSRFSPFNPATHLHTAPFGDVTTLG